MIAWHVRIIGQVQGVGFRYHTHHTASRLGVNGWVRNCPDGSVEVWAEADPAVLETFLSWLRQGPPATRVLHCEVDVRATQGFSGFTVWPDAA